MKAMILAAGLGTRLRPLTDERPKALVEIAGRTLLEITLSRLKEFGIHDVIINVHHFADKVIDYLKTNQNFGMQIEISREDVLLDTGGGLKKAGWFFQNDAEPFILHNVDVISSIDFECMLQFHKERQALATLAVQERKSSRYLLFNQELQLCGRKIGENKQLCGVATSGCGELQPLAFSGIHVISPCLLPLMKEEGIFPIIDSYLRLAGEGEKILAFRADRYYWRDVGKLESVAQAAEELKLAANQRERTRIK
jgi:NDP-sugar pyrophosphorylase family protein